MGYEFQITNADWRIDSDGFMRLTARILRDGVYEYDLGELPELAKQFPGKTKIKARVNVGKISQETLDSLEGKPLIVDAHEWRDPKNTLTDGMTIGACAGKPQVKGDSLMADYLIQDANAIEAIKRGDLQEVSAGYDAEYEPVTDGTADFEQKLATFNHVLALPKGRHGRCGPTVRILNALPGATPMKLEINGTTYEFSSEADATAAKNLAAAEKVRTCNAMSGAASRAMWAQVDDAGGSRSKDGKRYNKGAMKNDWHTEMEAAGFTPEAIKDAEKVKNAEEASAGKEAEQVATIAGLKKQLEEIAAKLATLESEEGQEAAAKEATEGKADEEAVVNALPEADKAKALDEVKNCKTKNERRKTLTVKVLNSQGLDASGYTDDQIGVAFKTLAAMQKRSVAGVLPNPGKSKETSRTLNEQGQARHPNFINRDAK
jgi:hypothetical protein